MIITIIVVNNIIIKFRFSNRTNIRFINYINTIIITRFNIRINRFLRNFS